MTRQFQLFIEKVKIVKRIVKIQDNSNHFVCNSYFECSNIEFTCFIKDKFYCINKTSFFTCIISSFNCFCLQKFENTAT